MALVTLPYETVSNVTRHLQHATAVNVSPFNFSQQVQDWGGRRWVYEFEFAVRQGAEGRALDAALNQIGTSGTFLWTEQTQRKSVVPQLYLNDDYAAGASAIDAGPGYYRGLSQLSDLDEVPPGAVDAGSYLAVPTDSGISLVKIPVSISDAWAGQEIGIWVRIRQSASQTPVATRLNVRYFTIGEGNSESLGVIDPLPTDFGWFKFIYTVPPGATNIPEIRIEPVGLDADGAFYDISEIGVRLEKDTDIEEPGDFISIGNGSSTRLHQIVSQTGDTLRRSLEIVPPLRSSAPADTRLEVAAPRVLLRPISPTPSLVSSPNIYRFNMQAVEAL